MTTSSRTPRPPARSSSSKTAASTPTRACTTRTSALTSTTKATRSPPRCATSSRQRRSKNVVEIAGAVGASAAIDRAKGFREKMGDCGIHRSTSTTRPATGASPESKAVMEAFLKKTRGHPGRLRATTTKRPSAPSRRIQDAGLEPGKDIQVVGVDATADGFKYLINGQLGADIECNPLLAPQVYEAALDGPQRRDLPPKWVPSQEGQFFAAQGADDPAGHPARPASTSSTRAVPRVAAAPGRRGGPSPLSEPAGTRRRSDCSTSTPELVTAAP